MNESGHPQTQAADGAAPDALTDALPDALPDAETVDEQSDRIGGLQRLHVVFVLCSLLVTLGAWQYASRTLEQRNHLRFDRQTEQVVEQLTERLAAQSNLLRSTVGFVESSGDANRERWQAYAAALDLKERFPALNGLAVARRVDIDPSDFASEPWSAPASSQAGVPSRARPRARGAIKIPVAHGNPARNEADRHGYRLPIMLTTPPSLNRALAGHDIAFEAERRTAIDRAFKDDAVTLTAPILPITATKPGVVMVAPYQNAPDGDARHDGAVVSSMLFDVMMRGSLAPNRRTIRLRISDAGETILDELATQGDSALDPQPLFSSVRTLHVYGRDWQLQMQSTRGFRSGAGVATPWLVLAFGLCLDALLISLLWLHGRAGGRLLDSARRLSEERRALANSNEHLETFACVVSHDLKAPLTGIRCLVDVMEDDVRDGADAATMLAHLQLARTRIERADTMIDGVMAYSEIGAREQVLEQTDIRALAQQIGSTLGVAPGQLQVDCAAPAFETDLTRLTQVLQNLIGNAFKYHPEPARAQVRVAVRETNERWLQIRVIDDGEGIEPSLRERVFEPFVTAHGTDRPDSNGVGLAIVRRAVESLGGTIEVEPTPGGGTTLAFTWPLHIRSGASTSAERDGQMRRGDQDVDDGGELAMAA